MSQQEAMQSEVDQFRVILGKVRQEIGKVIVGQDRVVQCTLTALFCGGNVLLEGVPGLGKTELVKTISKVLDLDYRRIQFTPDLMPADIIGTNIMNTDSDGSYRIEFRKGPIFTQLLLADEINRATPKTQSAMLETMQEKTVTVGGQTYELDPPFFVLATQNPIEQEGTYQLPEAQLDRFMFKAVVPFLDRDELNEVVARTIIKQDVEIEKVMNAKDILAVNSTLGKVVVADPIRDYAVRLVLATHGDSTYSTEDVRQYVRWGASPRAAQALVKGGRVNALAEGRAHLSFDDIRYYAKEVLQHRVLLNYDGQAESIEVAGLIGDLVNHVPEQA